MSPQEIEQFLEYLNDAWQPPLTDVQLKLWRQLVKDLDSGAVFTVMTRLWGRSIYRVKPPDFLSLYHRQMSDTHPVHVTQDRDEMPEWVAGWHLARSENDFRAWPEQEKGFRLCHEEYLDEVGRDYARKHGLKSGYEWEAHVAKVGLMPQIDRLMYMQRAKS